MPSNNEFEHLWKLISKCRFAMLVTNGPDGLQSRPMTTVQKEFDGNLWFFAPADSSAVHAIQSDDQVCLCYGNTGAADFVSVTGPASIISDATKKKSLWNPMVQAWFPQGAEADSVVLIKVRAAHCEYWDSNSSKLVQLFTMAKALATGTQPKEAGEHCRVM
jgi:general stress protein 26